MSNLGTFIFFLLNLALIIFVLCPGGITAKGVLTALGLYAVGVAVSLTPFGEWLMAYMAGAREIKDAETKIRLIPLLEEVMNRTVKLGLRDIKSVRLKIMQDKSANAFAVGRHTICVTTGLLSWGDMEIMGVFSHEMGHLVYRHTLIQMLIGSGNLLISGFLFLLQLVCNVITWVLTLFLGRTCIGGGLIAVFNGISSLAIWLWTKLCMIFLYWSMRLNEFSADEFACRLGFGKVLMFILDAGGCDAPETGMFRALWSTHPENSERVEKIRFYVE